MSRLVTIMKSAVPDENFVHNLDEYRAVWERAGFENLVVIDAPLECSRSYHKKLLKFAREQFRSAHVDATRLGKIQRAIFMSMFGTQYYVLVSGQKPQKTNSHLEELEQPVLIIGSDA